MDTSLGNDPQDARRRRKKKWSAKRDWSKTAKNLSGNPLQCDAIHLSLLLTRDPLHSYAMLLDPRKHHCVSASPAINERDSSHRTTTVDCGQFIWATIFKQLLASEFLRWKLDPRTTLKHLSCFLTGLILPDSLLFPTITALQHARLSGQMDLSSAFAICALYEIFTLKTSPLLPSRG